MSIARLLAAGRSRLSHYLTSRSRFLALNLATFGAITAAQYGWYRFRLK
jgi:hypothetical protein